MERRSVLQDWVTSLSFMQQSVLIAAMRGPDGVEKMHKSKTAVPMVEALYRPLGVRPKGAGQPVSSKRRELHWTKLFWAS